MTEHEIYGAPFRQIAAEPFRQDNRIITEMYADAIRISPTGEPYFTAEEQRRVDELTAAEEVIAEAEATLRSTGSATMAISGVEPAYV